LNPSTKITTLEGRTTILCDSPLTLAKNIQELCLLIYAVLAAQKSDSKQETVTSFGSPSADA
jgi:hypothetical protein